MLDYKNKITMLDGGMGTMLQAAGVTMGKVPEALNVTHGEAVMDIHRQYIEAGKDQQGKGFDPRKLLAPGFEAIKETVKTKMELFGSIGKA